MTDVWFTPQIDINGDEIVVVAPGEIIKNLWTVLDECLPNVVLKTGISNTSIKVSPYPGYMPRRVYIYTAVFLYTLVSELPLNRLFERSMGLHIQVLEDDILLPVLNDKNPLTTAIIKAEMEYALQVIFPYFALRELSELCPEWPSLEVVRAELHLMWNKARDAYSRLTFINPKDTFLTLDQWSRKTRICREQINIIGAQYNHISELQLRISKLEAEARRVILDFKAITEYISEGELSLSNIDFEFAEVRSKLMKLLSEAKEIQMSVDTGIASTAYKIVLSHTPVV